MGSKGLANKPKMSDGTLGKLLGRAQGGDKQALARTTELLRDSPEVWKRLSRLGDAIEDAIIGPLCGENELAREVIRREMSDKRREIEGPNPSAIDRLLAEQAVHAWAHVRHVEMVQMNNSREKSIAQHDQFERWVARAERRYLRVLSTLARVRRLLAPTMQIVDARQVNVMAGTANAQAVQRSGTQAFLQMRQGSGR